MAITKQDLELFKQEKLEEHQKIQDEKEISIADAHKKVEEYRTHIFNELDNRYSNKFAAINAQVEVLDKLIAQADKPEEIV